MWGFLSRPYIYSEVNSKQFVLKMTAFLSSSTSAASSWSENYHPSLGCLALWYQLANNLFCWHMIQLGCKTEWLWSKTFSREKAVLPKHGGGGNDAILLFSVFPSFASNVSLLTLVQCNNSVSLGVFIFPKGVNIWSLRIYSY